MFYVKNGGKDSFPYTHVSGSNIWVVGMDDADDVYELLCDGNRGW